MLVLGIESSCDETGLALFDTSAPTPKAGLLAHALHSQIVMHQAYGGVVPELASRDHIRRVIPLLENVLYQAGKRKQDIDAITYTAGPGLAGALLVGASFANALGFALNKPCYPVHHLEGHLLSPLLADQAPQYPFVALLVSGGHTQLIRVDGVGQYTLLGETLDDAAGEAFDKTAKLLGLPYPGGPALSALAEQGQANQYKLPRPMLHSGNFEFSFAGLKTAVLTQTKKWIEPATECMKADLARAFVDAIVDVLSIKATKAVQQCGLQQLVVAGGVGANRQLRAALDAAGAKHGFNVLYPALEFCTDNGAMIAFAGALRLQAGLGEATTDYQYAVTPRWDLQAYAAA